MCARAFVHTRTCRLHAKCSRVILRAARVNGFVPPCKHMYCVCACIYAICHQTHSLVLSKPCRHHCIQAIWWLHTDDQLTPIMRIYTYTYTQTQKDKHAHKTVQQKHAKLSHSERHLSKSTKKPRILTFYFSVHMAAVDGHSATQTVTTQHQQQHRLQPAFPPKVIILTVRISFLID